LRRGKHHSFILQKAWDKYGEASFDFKLLVICPKDQRIDYETRLMSMQTYNILRTPHEVLVRGGWSHTPEFKAKISVLHKGKVLTSEHIEKLSAYRTGRIESEEFRQKARARQLGVSPSSTTRNKLSQAVKNFRAAATEENKRKTYLIHTECLLGGKISTVCVKHGLSTTTFYAYCKKLALPLLKQKGKQYDL
jgi:hypothetical protein